MLFVNGEATTQSLGAGETLAAVWSDSVNVSVTGSHPPPFQNPDCAPLVLVSVAMLFDTVTGPQAPEYCFQTE